MNTQRERDINKLDSLRVLQDMFVARLEQRGYEDNSVVIDDPTGKTTLRQIKDMLYPMYEIMFREYLRGGNNV